MDTPWYKSFLLKVQQWKKAQFLFYSCISIIIWVFSSKGIQDAMVYGAFLFALFKASRGADAWKQPAGIAFIIVVIYMIVSLPFSVSPALSVRDFIKLTAILAGAFAIPVIFNTREKIKSALFYSAIGITLTLAYDIARLSFHLGPELFIKAHSFRPFILNHSNVASMMAGACCFIFFYFFWIWRRRFWQAFGCIIGLLLCLSYQFIVACRGPQIAFILTCCFIGFLIPGWRGKLLFFLCIAIAGILLLKNIQSINPRFLEEETMSTFCERETVWKHTWELIKKRPLFGYGYGKKTFVTEYYSSNPPKATFFFPHTHHFWLKILFEFGWFGLTLHLTAWLLLAYQLIRHTFSQTIFTNRLLPGTIGLILLFIHIYGMGDYPDNIVQMAQFWLIPVALVLTKKHREIL